MKNMKVLLFSSHTPASNHTKHLDFKAQHDLCATQTYNLIFLPLSIYPISHMTKGYTKPRIQSVFILFIQFYVLQSLEQCFQP